MRSLKLAGFLTTFTIYSQSIFTCANELAFTIVLFRHGDRTPILTFPEDQHAHPSNWNGTRMGQLTKTGKKQAFQLGQFLKRRYDKQLLSSEYSEDEIHIRTSDVDRVRETAYSLLAGIYPSMENPKWNVHSVSRLHDSLLSTRFDCPKMARLLTNLVRLPEIEQYINTYRPLFSYINEMAGIPSTGDDLRDILNAISIRDTFYVDTLYNKSLPSWASYAYPNPAMEALTIEFTLLSTYTPELARLRVGYFFEDILKQFDGKISGSSNPNLSAYMYGTHDAVVIWVMEAMQVFDRGLISYTGAVIFELYQGENGPHLELMYRKYPTDLTAKRLQIPGCEYQCPLPQFRRLIEWILPTEDFVTACK